jgi:hypothetical protein
MGGANPGPERDRPPARVADRGRVSRRRTGECPLGPSYRIANSPDASKHGGKASGKGGKAAAKKS